MGNRNKRGYLQDLPTRATTAFKGAAKKGVYVACVLVFVMHVCLCLCRLLQRGQHDVACLLVFVMHACSCLCRLLQRGTWPGHLNPKPSLPLVPTVLSLLAASGGHGA